MRIVVEATASCREVKAGIARYTMRFTDSLLAAAPAMGDTVRLGFRLSRWKVRGQCHRPAGVRTVWIAEPLWPPWPRADAVLGTDARVPAWRGVARVAVVHDVAVHIFPEFSSARFRERMRREWERLARSAHRLVADSESTRRDFLERFAFPPERMDVVHLGVEPVHGPLAPEERAPVLARQGLEGPYLLYVGELSRRKNINGLLEGYARSAARRELPLVLAGPLSFGAEQALERLRALGLEDRVRLLGYVPDGDLPALYGGAAAFVFPTHYEGFGLPVLEAMRCGTPVVGGNRGSVPEIAGGHAVLTDPEQPEDIAAGIDRALTLTPAQREAARAHAAGFTWERCAAETRAVLARAAAER